MKLGITFNHLNESNRKSSLIAQLQIFSDSREYKSNYHSLATFQPRRPCLEGVWISALLTSGRRRNIQHEIFWLDSQSPWKSSESPRTVKVWVSSESLPSHQQTHADGDDWTLRTRRHFILLHVRLFHRLFSSRLLDANGDKTEPHVRSWSPAKLSGVGCTANVGMRTPFSPSLLLPFLHSLCGPPRNRKFTFCFS